CLGAMRRRKRINVSEPPGRIEQDHPDLCAPLEGCGFDPIAVDFDGKIAARGPLGRRRHNAPVALAAKAAVGEAQVKFAHAARVAKAKALSCFADETPE